MPDSSELVRLRWVELLTCAESAISILTVRMSPMLVARWSPKKDRAPVRHSELGAETSPVGAGCGIDTRFAPATIAGFEIGVSWGEAMASDRPAHPASSAMPPTPARRAATPILEPSDIGVSYLCVTRASPSA